MLTTKPSRRPRVVYLFFVFKFPSFSGFYTGLAPTACGPAPHPCGSAPQILGPASFTSLASSRLQDKHQKLREGRRLASFLPSLLHNPRPTSPPTTNLHHFLGGGRRHDDHSGSDDSNKPKGKRPCKTKHTEGEETYGGGASYEVYNGKVGRTLSLFIGCCVEKLCSQYKLVFFRILSFCFLLHSLVCFRVEKCSSQLEFLFFRISSVCFLTSPLLGCSVKNVACRSNFLYFQVFLFLV